MAHGGWDGLLHIADHRGQRRTADIDVAEISISGLLRELEPEAERIVERGRDRRAVRLVEVELEQLLSFSTTMGAEAAKTAEASADAASISGERSMMVS